uniref:Myosin_tail_1 domain-containing protein n=1 Tax=Caenorhabditis tropicalis TaxID=1561998 RepID=A0A1I7UES2_9PELO
MDSRRKLLEDQSTTSTDFALCSIRLSSNSETDSSQGSSTRRNKQAPGPLTINDPLKKKRKIEEKEEKEKERKEEFLEEDEIDIYNMTMSEIQQYVDQINMQRKKINADCEEEVKSLNDLYETSCQKKKEMKESLEAARSSIEGLKNSLNEANWSLQKTQDNLAVSETQLKEAVRELESCKNDLAQEKAAGDKKLMQAEAEKKNLEATNEKLSQEAAETAKILEEKEKNLDSVKTKNEELRQEIGRVQEELRIQNENHRMVVKAQKRDLLEARAAISNKNEHPDELEEQSENAINRAEQDLETARELHQEDLGEKTTCIVS